MSDTAIKNLDELQLKFLHEWQVSKKPYDEGKCDGVGYAIDEISPIIEQYTQAITSLESHNRELLAVIAAKDELISQCIENNLHLADGDNCTLKLAKDAIAIKPGDIALVEVAAVDAMETGVEWNPITLDDVKAGAKLYALQKKEGK